MSDVLIHRCLQLQLNDASPADTISGFENDLDFVPLDLNKAEAENTH